MMLSGNNLGSYAINFDSSLFNRLQVGYQIIIAEVEGVSISKCEKCTLSKTECLTDVLLWLPKQIEEKGIEVW